MLKSRLWLLLGWCCNALAAGIIVFSDTESITPYIFCVMSTVMFTASDILEKLESK